MEAPPSPEDTLKEVRKCRQSALYFIDTYCSVLSEVEGRWVPFRLWPAQQEALDAVCESRLLVILKARQLGFSWMTLAVALWLAIFHPITTTLLFSRRDDEAVELLRRLRGMFSRLPAWLQAEVVEPCGSHEWTLASGSSVKAFPTTGGRSYTANLVVVDEADYVPDLTALLDAVKPTVDAGGKLVLLSTADKSTPRSAFKSIYRAAKQGQGGFRSVFHPWSARPDRDLAWYEEQRAYFLARDGSTDMLEQEYPASDDEALAPRSLDKRIPYPWLRQCYQEERPLARLPEGTPSLPGMEVYRLPVNGRSYVIGADPAEGNPTSDESALCVLDAWTGEEMASLAGRLEPTAFADAIDRIGRWYHGSFALVERNNHGHAVLMRLQELDNVPLLCGHDGRIGWLSSSKGKALLYGACADAFRHQDTILHSFVTLTQLQSVEGSTLKAPQGEADDRATAYALACAGIPAVLMSRTADERTVVITT